MIPTMPYRHVQPILVANISKSNVKPITKRSPPRGPAKNGNGSASSEDRYANFMANPNNVTQPLKKSKEAEIEANLEKRFDEMKSREDRAAEAAAKEAQRREKYGY